MNRTAECRPIFLFLFFSAFFHIVIAAVKGFKFSRAANKESWTAFSLYNLQFNINIYYK